jgi:CarboxypepD_reg-like domain
MIPGERLTPVLAAVLMSLAIAGSGPQGAQARQTSPSFLFRDVELSGALEYIARSGRLELVYSTDLVTGQRVFCDGRNLADEDLLRCVLTGTGLDYIRSSTGTYIIIRSLELLPALGALSGRIVDRATGAPLPYANILLVSAGIGSTSDAAGLFSFSGVPVGPQQVMASYVGFDAVLDTVFVSDDAGRYPKLIALNQAAMALDVIVVDGSSARRDPARSLETQGPERRVDVQLVSSVMSRALRAPGVSALHPLADVYIQGSDSGEHGTRLDGAPVYSPVSLGRYLSAFSPLALSRATVHRAAFPVELGSYLSGLVDVTQESGGDRGSLLEASVDPASANFRISTAPSGRGSGMLAVRTSLWPTVREPGLSSLLGSLNQIDPLLGTRWLKEAVSLSTVGEVIRDPQISFSDVHLGGTMGLGPVGRLEASAYRGDNRIGTELSGVNTAGGSSAPHAFVTDDAYRWSNTVGQVRYSTLLRARTHLVVQAYGSAHRARYRYRTGDVVLDSETNADGAILRLRREGTAPAAESENRMDEFGFRGALTHSLRSGRTATIGVELEHLRSGFALENPFLWNVGTSDRATLAVGFLSVRADLGRAGSIYGGVRATWVPQRNRVYSEPRVSWLLPSFRLAHRLTSVRLAAGLHRQFVHRLELASTGPTALVPYVSFWLPVDATIAPSRALHGAVEILTQLSETLTLSVDGFLKEQRHLLAFDHGALQAPTEPVGQGQDRFVAAGRGRALGLRTSLTWESGTWRIQASHDFSRVERVFPGLFDNRMTRVPWTAPHVFRAQAEVALWPDWRLRLGSEIQLQRTWAFRRSYYEILGLGRSLAGTLPVDLSHPERQQLPAFWGVDAGLTHDRRVGSARVRMELTVANLLDRRNIQDIGLDRVGGRWSEVPRTLPGRRLTARLRIGV